VWTMNQNGGAYRADLQVELVGCLAPEKMLKRCCAGRRVRQMLEVIDKGSATESHPVPLLFVHGGCLSAWCWDDHFLDFFADNGYRAIAPSLRGHSGSPVSKPLNKCTIADYVDDVRSVAATLPATPVLVGHSMGGFIVQKYLESGTAPAAVLVSSAPPRSWFRTSLWSARKHPWLAVKVGLTRSFLSVYPTPAHMREVLFCAHTPEPIVERCFARLQEESLRALGWDMYLLVLVRPRRVTTPMLVLEGVDIGWGPRPARENARAYHTEAVFFPDMGHNMMLEPGWQAVAERIVGWLTARGL
jgi:pimeloyl-ACP methyl ester carboxylesterase